MGNLAIMAKEKGFLIAGSDGEIYPPMNERLRAVGIKALRGFEEKYFEPNPDTVIIGNSNLPRGTQSLEFVLNNGFHYMSGAEWFAAEILRGRHVIAISGTHGKTTTTSMVAWILEYAGLEPGFLVGGAPLNFDSSARLGAGNYFVVEADEYDTSYFDRRSKFLHYRPNTLIINNIEFDHADIFTDLAAIQYQFHHLIRSIPNNGSIIVSDADEAIEDVLSQGCWSPVSRYGIEQERSRLDKDSPASSEYWRADSIAPDGSSFVVLRNDNRIGTVSWDMIGSHNVSNALGAIVAACHIDVPPGKAIEALCRFKGVKRRMQHFATLGSCRFYDDFAHHPTSIRATLQALRNHVGTEKILAVIEPRTHTMSLGFFRKELAKCCGHADEIIWYRDENIKWDLVGLTQSCVIPSSIADDIDALVDRLCVPQSSPCHILIMSNGAFGGVYRKITNRSQN